MVQETGNKTQVELFPESEQQKVSFSQKYREDQGLLIVKKKKKNHYEIQEGRL